MEHSLVELYVNLMLILKKPKKCKKLNLDFLDIGIANIFT